VTTAYPETRDTKLYLWRIRPLASLTFALTITPSPSPTAGAGWRQWGQLGCRRVAFFGALPGSFFRGDVKMLVPWRLIERAEYPAVLSRPSSKYVPQPWCQVTPAISGACKGISIGGPRMLTVPGLVSRSCVRRLVKSDDSHGQ
jgi:hypothetical protein